MKVVEKLRNDAEKQALDDLLPRHQFILRRKTFWKIPTESCHFELVALGRQPCGVDVDFDIIKLASISMDIPDLFEANRTNTTSGKYRVETISFTGSSPKFEGIRVHYDNILDFARLNCTGVEPMALICQNVYKKRTHVGAQEYLKCQSVKMYFKFNMI